MKELGINQVSLYDQTAQQPPEPMPEPNNNPEKENFLHPRSSYHGNFTPANLVFNANLQEFSQRVEYICALETGGKMTSDQAYQEIKQLYKKLKLSKRELGIGDPPPEPPSELPPELRP
jgi:hypothetical protein